MQHQEEGGGRPHGCGVEKEVEGTASRRENHTGAASEVERDSDSKRELRRRGQSGCGVPVESRACAASRRRWGWTVNRGENR
eukprot:1011401-Rhodomonas_salina.2